MVPLPLAKQISHWSQHCEKNSLPPYLLVFTPGARQVLQSKPQVGPLLKMLQHFLPLSGPVPSVVPVEMHVPVAVGVRHAHLSGCAKQAKGVVAAEHVGSKPPPSRSSHTFWTLVVK